MQKYAPGDNEHAAPAKPSRPRGSNANRGGSSKPKKNKPMSRVEQEARISELQGKLRSYEQGGSDDSPPPGERRPWSICYHILLLLSFSPQPCFWCAASMLTSHFVSLANPEEEDESSDDEDESGSESEEE